MAGSHNGRDEADYMLPPQPVSSHFDIDSSEEIFHENTKWHRRTFFGPMLRIVSYLKNPLNVARGAAGYTCYPAHEILSLPSPQQVDAQLSVVLAKRRSAREFADSISLQDVSSLLWHSLAVKSERTSEVAVGVPILFRPYPSAGALNSIEIYAYLNNVVGIAPCIAHYDPISHHFRKLRSVKVNAFSKVAISQTGEGIVSPLVLVVAMVPQRQTQKYGRRGYRHALLEVGHSSQNVCLIAEAIGLGSLVYSAYFDDELAAELGLDSVTEVVASTILVGPRP